MVEPQISLAEQLLATMQELILVLDQEEQHLDTQNFDDFAENVIQKQKLCQDMHKQLEQYSSLNLSPMEDTIQEAAPLLRKKLIRNQRKLKSRIRFQKLMLRLFTECLGGTDIPATYSPQGQQKIDTASVNFQQKA